MDVSERWKNSITYEGKDDNIKIVLSGTRHGDTNSGTMTINYVMEKGSRNIDTAADGSGNSKKSDDECSIVDHNYSDNGNRNSTGVVIEGHTGNNKAMRFEITAENQGTKKTQKNVGVVIMPSTTGNLRNKSEEEHQEVAEITEEEDHVGSAAYREIECAVSITASFMIIAEEEGKKGDEGGIRSVTTAEEKNQNRKATGVMTVCNVDDNVGSKSDDGKELADTSKMQDRVVAAVNEEIKTVVDKASPAEVWNDIVPANPEVKFKTPVTFTSLALSPDMNRTKASPNAEQQRKFVRSPICCLMGHADAGKTKLFDCILGTDGSSNNVQEGCLTESIGVASLPACYVQQRTKRNLKVKFGSLVLVDTRGHETLALGSSCCDFAIVAVDIMHGVQQQTVDSLNLLKLRNTRFIVALTKLDYVCGWKSCHDTPISKAIMEQSQETRDELFLRIMHVTGQLLELGIDADLFYKNRDVAGEKVHLVPIIAASGEGIPDLMQVLVKWINRTMLEKITVIPRRATDVVSANGVLRESHEGVDFVLQGPVATAVRVLLTCRPMAGLVDEGKGRRENKSSMTVCERVKNSIPFRREDGAIILFSGPGYRDVSIMLPTTAKEGKQNQKATGVMTVCNVNENVGCERDDGEEKVETCTQQEHAVAVNKEIKTAMDKASPAEVQNDITPTNPEHKFKTPVTFTSLAVSPDTNRTWVSPNAEREWKFVRSPICCLMGHADAGKTKLFDCFRGTTGSCSNVLEGCLTESIGVASLPAHYIRQRTERNLKMNFGSLVLVDFPGHEGFADVRALGSGFCDFAIVVVDIMHGLQPQTVESLNLLKLRNTWFIVALNKLDHVRGWKTCPNTPFFEAYKQQSEDTRYELALKILQVVFQLKWQGIDAGVFYKNTNIAGAKVLLVPTNAASGEGIRELMQLLVKWINRTMLKKIPVIPRIATDVVSVNCMLHELHKSVDFVLKGPVATAVRVLLSCCPTVGLVHECEGRMENKEGDSGSAYSL